MSQSKVQPAATQLSANRGKSSTAKEPRSCIPMFDPENKWRLRWDMVIMVFIVYNAIFVPMTLCLELTAPALTWIDNIADAFFIVDVFMSFRTGFNVRDGAETWLVMESNQIAMRYLRGWFPIDVVSIGIPFGLVDQVDGITPLAAELFKATSALKIFRLLRLPRLLSRLITVSIEYQHIATMISLITLFFYFCHFFGCFFYYIARLNYTCTETAEAHALRVAANNGTEVEWSGEGGDCTWILAAGLNGTGTDEAPITVTSKYVTSLYWAMMTATTVGYGDIGIMNTSEQMFAVVIMILSNLMGAIIFGNVATLIQSLNAGENRHANRIEMVEELIETHGISDELAERMRETIEYQWDLTRCFDMDQALELLPQSLRVDVLMYVHKQLIMKVPFFQDCDDAFIKTVVYRLRSELVLTKDVIFHEGDAADEMYFLRRGNVNVLAPRSTRVVATLNEGGFFGEIGILVENGRRTNTVVASTKCEYYTLQKSDLDWVLDRFPEYRQLLREAALKRLQEMAKVLDASLAGEEGLDLIEGRVLVEIQEMRGSPLTHQGFEKFCRVSVSDHVQNTNHPQNEHGDYAHDARGHIQHKYDFAAILNFHFEVEQRSYDKMMVLIEIVHKHRLTGEKVEGVIKVPLSSLKHGEYAGGWRDVYVPTKGNKSPGKKIGELYARLLLHKEGLSKEQRRSTITQNMLDLDGSSNSLSDSSGSNSGGASKTNDWRGTAAATSKTQDGGSSGGAPSQAQIEAEARLARLETELARAVQMMSDVAESVAKLTAQEA